MTQIMTIIKNSLPFLLMHQINATTPYSRYPAYPPYCSTPTDMSHRQIPPLESTVSTHLLQVNAIIRHGSRTPFTSNFNCWNEDDDETNNNDVSNKWDCQLTTLMSPPKPDNDAQHAMFLFEKKYDALNPPEGNLLGGTCHLGQLLHAGYDQELSNGQILRQAYLDRNDNLFLYKGVEDTPPYDTSLLYFRGDDEQRTLMSGQILIRGLFGEEIQMDDEDVLITIHTADRAADVLVPNTNICPRLKDLTNEAESSEDFLDVMAMEEVRELIDVLERLGTSCGLDGFEPIDIIHECLMTTICNDRTLPEVLDDYGIDGGMFQRMASLSTWKFGYRYFYNNAAFAKLAMGPLWAEVTEKMKLTYDIEDHLVKEREAPRMALYSGHDTTIMPLLASLGLSQDTLPWTPYASMFIIEVHAILQEASAEYPTQRAFRLLYNGDVITSLIDGCPVNNQLCDLQILLQLVDPFATRDRSCASSSSSSTSTTATTTTTKTTAETNTATSHAAAAPSNDDDVIVINRQWLVLTMMVTCLVVGLLTFMATFISCEKRLPFQKTKRLDSNGQYGATTTDAEFEFTIS